MKSKKERGFLTLTMKCEFAWRHWSHASNWFALESRQNHRITKV